MVPFFIPTCWICNKEISLESCKVDEYGKGVHADCYTTMLAHPNGKSIGEKEKRSWELCTLAKEDDPHRLVALVAEINALLKKRAQIRHLRQLLPGPPQD